jgi:hypothetical protein
MTQILVYGKIFNPIRPKTGWFGQLFGCHMCTGFWVGLFLWSVKDYTQLINFDDSLITALLLGCVSSASSYLIGMLIGDDGFRIEKTSSELEEQERNN